MNTFTLTDYLNAREVARFDGYNPYNTEPQMRLTVGHLEYMRERAARGPLNEFDANGAIVRGGM